MLRWCTDVKKPVFLKKKRASPKKERKLTAGFTHFEAIVMEDDNTRLSDWAGECANGVFPSV